MTLERKLILYIAMSLDGYIAGINDDIGFLSIVEQTGEDYGYQEFIKHVDTIIIGRRSYDKVISMGFEYPHKDKEVYIISRTPNPGIGTFKYYSDDLRELVLRLKSKPGKDIFCDGGAEIVNVLLMDNLLDEFVISVIPIMLGDGVSLFKKGRPELKLQLINSIRYDKGLVQLHYIRKEKSSVN
jgi:dihydrofolate reductase